MTHPLLAGLTSAALLWMPQVACAQHSQPGSTPELYATKAEAEAAAKQFNCTGAHAMGDKWMPCDHHPGSSQVPAKK